MSSPGIWGVNAKPALAIYREMMKSGQANSEVGRTLVELAPCPLTRSWGQGLFSLKVANRAFSIGFPSGCRLESLKVKLREKGQTVSSAARKSDTDFPLRSTSSPKPQRTTAHGQVSRHLSQWSTNGSSFSSQPARHFPQQKHSTLSRASQLGLKKKPASVRVSGVATKLAGWGHLRDTVRFAVDCFTRLAFVKDCRRDSNASIGDVSCVERFWDKTRRVT